MLPADGSVVVNPSDVSLEAVVREIHKVCDAMNGNVQPGKTLLKNSIRCAPQGRMRGIRCLYRHV